MGITIYRPEGESMVFTYFSWCLVRQLADLRGSEEPLPEEDQIRLWNNGWPTLPLHEWPKDELRRLYESYDGPKEEAEQLADPLICPTAVWPEGAARRLADDLERVLPDILDERSEKYRGHRTESMTIGGGRVFGVPSLREPVDLLAWFSGPEKERIRDLIAFLREGAFFKCG